MFGLTDLLERDESVPVSEVRDRIRNGTLFAWLKDEYGGIVDPWLFEVNGGLEGHAALEHFERLIDVMTTPLGENGIALLLYFCVEVVQERVSEANWWPTAGALGRQQIEQFQHDELVHELVGWTADLAEIGRRAGTVSEADTSPDEREQIRRALAHVVDAVVLFR